MNPLKVYEYLAMQKPVVATDLPELEGLSGVWRCESREIFLDQLQRAVRGELVIPPDAAAGHSLSARVDALTAFVGIAAGADLGRPARLLAE